MAKIKVHFDTGIISLEYVDTCEMCEIVVKFNGYMHKGVVSLLNLMKGQKNEIHDGLLHIDRKDYAKFG